MKVPFTAPVSRAIGALTLGVALAAAAVPALSQPGPHPEGMKAHRMVDEADRVAFAQKRLDRLAGRLEIKASQQAAWKAYSQVVIEQARRMAPPRPDAKADAATVLRARAEQMNQRSRQLGQLADATARLSAALSAEQRQVLDASVREHGRFHHRHGGKPHGERP